MASGDDGFDWWLLLLVAVIFVAGISVYAGWDDVGVLARKARLFVFSFF